ncbi:MAG: HDIG domain-containing protein [Muribaculaceae bacterium]|nr:HDIG domain-containing protein [Muribaculaceae bacterium]
MFTRKFFYRCLLFIVSALLIVVFLPKESEHHFAHEINRPWSYSLLTAPFDIPVYRDTTSVRHLKDSIDRVFEPVFKRDVTLEKTSVSEFAKRLNSTPNIKLTPAQKNIMLGLVEDIYENGIVSPETDKDIHSGKIRNVRFITDNVAISVPAKSFLSTREAYAYLDSAMRTPEYRTALSLISSAEILHPNIGLDTVENSRLLNDLYKTAMAPIGVIQQGERIIDRGELVTPKLSVVLDTYEEMANKRTTTTVNSQYYPLAGQALFVAILLGCVYLYLLIFRPAMFEKSKNLVFILLMMVSFVIFTAIMNVSVDDGAFMVPMTILPIMAVIFLDSRTALFLHIVTTLICASMIVYQFGYIIMQFVAGCVAIDAIKDLSRRSQLIKTAFLVFLSYSVTYVAMEVMVNGSVMGLQPRMFGNLAVNAVLVSFAYILMFIIEKMFGFTSRVTLVELSDINLPLLRELSEKCPGTFDHSMRVGNLAAEAAAKIGANVQLVRTGALYHDIGKTRNPSFFTENQHGVNPHDTLDPQSSARIVIGHVEDGMRMAKDNKLPEIVRNFITEHHGKGMAKYFYNTYCNDHPDEEVDSSKFSYPGPNPRSREASILMMADAVEAASRSLPEYTPEAIRALVDKIVNTQVIDGLHSDSDLSFHDIKVIKETFVKLLQTMYHSRISYPDLKK